MKALANPSNAIRIVGLCILSLRPVSGTSYPDGWDGCR
jgi:hypothetical protein